MTNGTANGQAPKKLKLKYIGRADFRKTEATAMEEVIAELGQGLKAHECVILISNNGKIMRFVFGTVEHDQTDARGKMLAERITKILPSRTYRITQGGTFNPYMLQNYANDLGIELEHLKRLEAHLRLEAEQAHAAAGE